MYAQIKLANPGFPFLIREAEGTAAKITGRYGRLPILRLQFVTNSGKKRPFGKEPMYQQPPKNRAVMSKIACITY
jgi:hypothetical protein